MNRDELFMKAIELREEERAAFLIAECGEDTSLRDEIQLLVEAHQSEDSLLDDIDPESTAESLSGRPALHDDRPVQVAGTDR